jgi:hypothetical protein
MIRGRNEEVSQEALTKFLSSKPGDEITAPYFSKGNVYFPDIPNKNYLIETGLPNENFQQSYMWKFGEGTGPNDMGAAVLHPDPNLRNLGNFNIYEKNWLEGYKKVPQPTNTQQITRGPINWWDEPKYKKQNPNFNPQTYLNNPVGNQFYCPQYEPTFKKYALPHKVFSYIAWRESRCNPGAVNAKWENGQLVWTLNSNGSYDSGLLQINSSWFKTLRESTDFVNTLNVPESVIEVKYYDPNDPNQPKPPSMHI